MRKLEIIIYSVIAFIIFLTLVKRCESTKTITKVKTEIKYITDTITKVEISKPKVVYYKLRDTIKVNDTIYLTKHRKPIKANEYTTTIESDSASAKLQITTTGQLLDVKGVITYPKETKTIETIKTRSNSGLFLYGASNINKVVPEVGLMYQFKNTLGIMGGVEYNQLTNSVNSKLGILIRIY